MKTKLLTSNADELAAYRSLLPKVQGRLARAALERLILEAEAPTPKEEERPQAARLGLRCG